MTYDELEQTPAGTVLHFTNWPGKASVPVTKIGPRGLIRFTDGKEISAFPDELTTRPRRGLEVSA